MTKERDNTRVLEVNPKVFWPLSDDDHFYMNGHSFFQDDNALTHRAQGVSEYFDESENDITFTVTRTQPNWAPMGDIGLMCWAVVTLSSIEVISFGRIVLLRRRIYTKMHCQLILAQYLIKTIFRCSIFLSLRH